MAAPDGAVVRSGAAKLCQAAIYIMCICFVLCDCLLPTSSPSFYDSVPGIASLASAMNRGRLLRGYTNTNDKSLEI